MKKELILSKIRLISKEIEELKNLINSDDEYQDVDLEKAANSLAENGGF